MDPKALFSTLTNACKAGLESPEEEIQKLNPSDIWPQLFEIAEKNPKSISVFISLLTQYCLFDDSFRGAVPENAKNEILKLKSEEISEDQKIQIIKKSLLLMPFFDAENAAIVFDALVSVIDKEIHQKPVIPQFFVDLINNYDIDADTPVLEVFFEKFQKSFSGNLSAATMIAYSPFAIAALESNVDDKCICSNNASKMLTKEKLEKIAGLFLFKNTIALYIEEPTAATKPLFKSISQLMVSSDSDIQYAAHKTLRSMIDYGLFVSKQTINALIQQFGNYDEKTLPLFFKTMQRFLDDNEHVSLDISSAIYEFAKKKLSSESAYVASEAIDLLTSIGHCNVKFIQPVAEQAIKVIENIVKSDVEGVASKCAGFLAILKQGEQFIPTFIEALASEKQTIKQRYELATALATMCTAEEDIAKVLKIATDALNELKNGEIYYVISIFVELIPKLNDESANSVFGLLFDLLKKQDDGKKANAITDALKKLVKKHKITEEKVNEAVNEIMDAKLPIFNELPLYTFSDVETVLFHFVAVCITKFAAAGKSQCEKILPSLASFSLKMLPAILEIVEACINTGCLPKEEIEKLVPQLLPLVESLSTSDDNEVCAVVEVIKTALSHCDFDRKKIFDSLSALLTSDESSVNMESFPKLFTFVIEVASSPLEDSFAQFVSKSLPMEPPAENDSVYKALLALNSTNQLPVEILKCFVDICFMKKSQTDALGITAETLEGAKNAIIAAIEDKEVQKALLKTFGSSRAKQNRFTTYFKK